MPVILIHKSTYALSYLFQACKLAPVDKGKKHLVKQVWQQLLLRKERWGALLMEGVTCGI